MLEVLDKKHPDYHDRQKMWQRYWDFYAGGEQLRRNAGQYLVRRQKEPSDVYQERLSRVFYENYLGSCVDWYAATLFRTAPRVTFSPGPKSAQEFYSTFLRNADSQGTPLLELIRKVFIETLVFKQSYVLIDFPRVTDTPSTRAEEDAIGKSRAYMVPFSPGQLINWKRDEHGQFDWVVLKTERVYQQDLSDPSIVREQRWALYDRERFRIYVSREKTQADGSPATESKGSVELIDEGTHGLARQRRVPLVEMAVTDGMWLANKGALLQQEHFNKANALSWALHMGLFAMPVVYSEREWQQIVGEAYYIQLGPNDRFGWTEPEGHVYQIAAESLDRLKDEIYRVCYLMTQAGGRETRNVGQSGLSKQRDFAVTHEVLRGYGGTIREFIRQILQLIRDARSDEIAIDVSGLDQFDGPDLADELANAGAIQNLGVPSERLSKELRKRVALKYLEGASQEIQNEVVAEIESA